MKIQLGSILLIIVFVIIISLSAIFFLRFGNITNIISNVSSLQNEIYNNTNQTPQNFSINITPNAQGSTLDYYLLKLINSERQQYALSNVTLSNITSAQQHAENVFSNHYVSHWDIYGMKPYMRYTLLGGTGAVSENIAFIYNSRGINVTSATESMENTMLYNDSTCCKNGHAYNILNKYHNQVSIGIAYNRTLVYVVEDFINNLIDWKTPITYENNGEVHMQGIAAPGFNFSGIQISYDNHVTNMTVTELNKTSEYSYGSTIAGVDYNLSEGKEVMTYFYPGIINIQPDSYSVNDNYKYFKMNFSIANLTRQNGPGEYTIMIYLTQVNPIKIINLTCPPDHPILPDDKDGGGTSGPCELLAATYTIFIGSNGSAYVPTNV